MDLTKKLSILVFLLCVIISLKNRRAETDSRSLVEDSSARRNLGGDESHHSDGGEQESLLYDFYTESCPSAENIVRSAVRELHALNNTVAPQLLRLAFHDCFVMGCDASILLDSDGEIKSEKEALPNLSIKGFEHIDAIKSRLEHECPGIVSCADIVALAAREAVLLAGGQFYPVLTGRMDSKMAFPQNASTSLPGPNFDVAGALRSFAAKGFDARETVALLGAHSTGKIHCNFIHDRLFNFSETHEADPAIDVEFLEVLRSECSHPSSAPSLPPSPSSSADNKKPTASFDNRGIRMDYEGSGKGFGEVYYRSLLQGKGILFVDQQLIQGQETKPWVEAYAMDRSRFRRDFGLAMFKLTHLQDPSAAEGEVRLNCRKVNKAV